MSCNTDLQKRCTEAGLKMTGQRKTIIQVLESSEDHPSVETVFERAKAIDDSISIATVYRTLSLLQELDLILKHEFKETFSRFEANMEHHHHLIDLDTGEVIEFQNEELEKLKEKIANDLGFDLVDHQLELYGRKIKKN
ncbi:MAG: transcriptional repressor [Alphaproteobacteria bacterium]|nr:transcriptional repressor [Alphaproteobacteria bacterium]